MIGLDSNVLLRFLARDHPEQSRRARHLLTRRCSIENPGFVSLIVLVKIMWTLKRVYKWPAAKTLEITETLLNTPNIRIERQDLVHEAIGLCGLMDIELADALIVLVARHSGCVSMVSFDRTLQASGLATGP